MQKGFRQSVPAKRAYHPAGGHSAGGRPAGKEGIFDDFFCSNEKKVIHGDRIEKNRARNKRRGMKAPRQEDRR